MALFKEYSREERGLKRKEDFEGFSYSYYRFFSQFRMHYDGTFLFEDIYHCFWPTYILSNQLFFRCNHYHSSACSECILRPRCDTGYCPCPRCFKTYSQRGVIPTGESERVVLELLDFVHGQMAWIVKFKTQKEIRQNPEKMKEEARRRIKFFIRKLEEKKNKFLSLSYEKEREFFRNISDSKEHYGF